MYGGRTLLLSTKDGRNSSITSRQNSLRKTHRLIASSDRSNFAKRARMVNFDSGLWSLLGQAPAEEFDVEDNGLGDNFQKYIDTIETNILSKHQKFEGSFNGTEKTENKDLYGQHQNDKKRVRKTSTNFALNSSVLLLPQANTTSSQPQANGYKVLNQVPEEKSVLNNYFHSPKANQHQKVVASAAKMIPSINPGTDIYMIEEGDGLNTYQDLKNTGRWSQVLSLIFGPIRFK